MYIPFISRLRAEARAVASELNINDGITDLKERQNRLDAFTHAYTSAVMAYRYGEDIAKIGGDLNEVIRPDNPPEEENMDKWNNAEGREIGKSSNSIDEIKQRIKDALNNGDLITNPDPAVDPRRWEEPTPNIESSAAIDTLYGTLDRLRSLFYDAESATYTPPRVDPLILDLDDDGIETTNVKDGAYFDHDGNGFAEQSGWAGADDGLLVMDRNGDGIINDGKELFGDQTILNNGQRASNGFQALSDLDSNADGKIDANDTAFANLKVWQDIDGDGYSSADELKTLSDVGITSLNTGYTDTNITDANGNTQAQAGTFEKVDGTTGAMGSFLVQRDTVYTIANEWLDVPEDIAALPDLQGYGNVYDLQQAMAREALSGQQSGVSLKNLVEQFAAATDTATRNSLMEQILFKWTGSEGIDPASRGGNIDARKLAVLEKFYGEVFDGTNGSNPNVNAAPLLNQSYNGLSEMFYAQLMAQTHLKSLYEKITYTWDETTQSVKGDLSAVTTEIENRLAANDETIKPALSELVRTIKGFDAGTMMNLIDFQYYFASKGPEFGSLVGVIIGGTGNDSLSGNAEANVIMGYDGNDSLYGYEGDDILVGGKGADYLKGYDGNDNLSGDEDNDYLYGEYGDDKLIGGSGDDYLSGGNGNDTLDGSAGNDSLYGEAGDDVLDGGAGNDILQGSYGNDIYKFGRGSGQDIIQEDYNNSSTDIVEFGSNITKDDIELLKEENHLRINIKDTTDSLLITNWFLSSNYRVEQFKFADGTVLTQADIDAMGYKVYGTAGNDNLYGNVGNDTLYGGSGADKLYGNGGDDTIDGGSGSDYLEGGTGNDTYKFSLGSGSDTIWDYSYGTDTVDFGEGITVADIELVKENSNLRVNIKGTTNSLIIKDWFSGDSYKIEQFKFADGSLLTPADLDAIGYKVYGTSGSDYLNGSNASDDINGYEGNDSLGGGSGNDVLDGGAGNDYLNGGTGNDTYKFSLGSGQDTIIDGDSTVGNIDTIEFGAGITSTDIELVKEDSNLRINIKGTSDSLIIQSWFGGNDFKIEQFKFADGTILTSSDIDAIGYKVYGTSGNDWLYGSNLSEEIYGYEGDDYLAGYGGNDTYKIGLGSGQDTIWDYDYYMNGIDTVEFGEGINSGDIELIKEGYHLRVNIKGTTDSLLIQNWFSDNRYRIEQFKFADGIVLKPEDMGYKIYGTSGSDDLRGLNTNDEIYGYEGNDVLVGNNGNDMLDGGTGNDGLNGGDGNDILYGDAGDDVIAGGSGDDILDGGTGNDYMYDEAGNDTYKFGIGSGADAINDYDSTVMNIDRVEFGEDITRADLEFIKEGNSLRINIRGTIDSLLIQNWFSGDIYKIEQFKFTDGTVITASDIDAIGYKVYGTGGNDYLTGSSEKDEMYGYEGNDSLWGYGGDDILYGGAGSDILAGLDGNDIILGDEGDDSLYGDYGSDVLDGGAGNDYLYGHAGDDILTGGTDDDQLYGYDGNDVLDGGIGNDFLHGWYGNDVYVFKRGYGQDSIYDYDETIGNIDTVEFGEDITNANLEFLKENNNLRIDINGTNDSLIIQNWFASDIYKIEQFKFADGTIINASELMVGTTSGETLNGTINKDAIYGNAGSDKIYGKAGDDMLSGGAGTDTIYGDDGNDTLYGGTEADKLYGGTGDDALYGGAGNDTLKGEIGSDIYKFGIGSGQDTITDYSTDAAATQDIVDIEVNPLDLIFSKSNKNLVVSINGTTDKATIQNWYSGTAYQTEVFQASDGSRLLNTQVEQLIQAMATFTSNNGMSWSDAIQQKPQEVQAVLAQYWEPNR